MLLLVSDILSGKFFSALFVICVGKEYLVYSETVPHLPLRGYSQEARVLSLPEEAADNRGSGILVWSSVRATQTADAYRPCAQVNEYDSLRLWKHWSWKACQSLVRAG